MFIDLVVDTYFMVDSTFVQLVARFLCSEIVLPARLKLSPLSSLVFIETAFTLTASQPSPGGICPHLGVSGLTL
jgi:hypothetical protein